MSATQERRRSPRFLHLSRCRTPRQIERAHDERKPCVIAPISSTENTTAFAWPEENEWGGAQKKTAPRSATALISPRSVAEISSFSRASIEEIKVNEEETQITSNQHPGRVKRKLKFDHGKEEENDDKKYFVNQTHVKRSRDTSKKDRSSTDPNCASSFCWENTFPTKNRADNHNKNEVVAETQTGWSLEEGMKHIQSVHGGILVPWITKHGPPPFYPNPNSNCNKDCQDLDRELYWTFRSLCRIVIYQQLSGKVASSIWNRFASCVAEKAKKQGKMDSTLSHEQSSGVAAATASMITPINVLKAANIPPDKDEKTQVQNCALRLTAGLSNAKMRSVLDLSRHYVDGRLSDAMLVECTSTSSSSLDQLKDALLRVRGVGPWSVDMFCMFHLHHPDVFPLGDLAVRKGTALVMRAMQEKESKTKEEEPSGQNTPIEEKTEAKSSQHDTLGGTEAKSKSKTKSKSKSKSKTKSNKIKIPSEKGQDGKMLQEWHAPFAPYRSLSSYYMWRVVEVPTLD